MKRLRPNLSDSQPIRGGSGKVTAPPTAAVPEIAAETKPTLFIANDMPRRPTYPATPAIMLARSRRKNPPPNLGVSPTVDASPPRTPAPTLSSRRKPAHGQRAEQTE